MVDVSPWLNLWNKLIYGWDLTQIGKTLFIVPDFSHWSIDSTNPFLNEDKFQKQLEEKDVRAIIYKGTDSNYLGQPFTDKTAGFWWKVGEKFNLLRGSYHWLQPTIDPTVAFNYHNDYIHQYPTELPYILDFEEPRLKSASDYLWRAKTWLNLAKQNLNDDLPIVYTAPWFINDYIKPGILSSEWELKIGWLREFPLWVARYSRYIPKDLWPWTDFTGWQYTSSADFPYYKDNDNYWGDEWGIPSKGLDISLFKIDWLSKYEKEPQGGDMWKNNARGLYVEGTQKAVLDGYDYLIAKIGPEFHNNVQTAYDNKKPVILFADNKIFKWHVDYGINKDIWPTAEQEPLIVDHEYGLDRYMMSNGQILSSIDGIMLNCSATQEDDTGNPLTVTWIVERAKWMLDMIYNRYKIPVYMYMDKNAVNKFAGTLDVEAIYGLIIQRGVSTVSKAATVDGFPIDTERPSLPYDDTSVVRWDFWLYDFTDGWKFLYRNTKEELYKELNFSEIPEDPDPGENPNEEVLERIEGKLDLLIGRINSIFKE